MKAGKKLNSSTWNDGECEFMKKKYFILFILIIIVFSGSAGCTMVNGPTHGFLYSDITFAGEINPSNDVRPLKKAIGCQHGVFFLLAWGNAAAGRIAKNSGITRISKIDHKAMNVYYIYNRYCTIVYGE